MKNLITLFIAGLALMFATFASAAGIEDMTDTERAAFRAEVRAYLLDNPEVILEAIQVLEERQAQQAAVTDLDLVQQNYDALVNDGFSFVGGNPDGAITIVEFSDYRCPYCKRAYTEVMALLEENDDVRFVLKEFPILGPDSTLASQAAISVLVNQGPELYEKFHDALMTYNGPINRESLDRIAADVGVDVQKMDDHMDDDLVNQIIASNRALAQTMQITGTPTFIIGPEMLRGYAPQATMQEFVDRARQHLQQ